MTLQNSTYFKGNRGIFAGVAFAALIMTACSHKQSAPTEEPWLARVDNNRITVEEVRKAVPSGLNEEDSIRFVRAYVNNWVESHLISQVASDEVDMEQVDRLVEEYRRNLIVNLYRRAMFETHAKDIADDTVAAYYAAHSDEWHLERPMVKGTYLKLPDDATNLRTVRRLYNSSRPADIDRLEKEVLSTAVHYDYFRDRWVDWEQIESRIPYAFGDDPSTWLSRNKTLDLTTGGFTYLLSITDILPVGSPTPIEGVRSEIINRILRSDRQAYDAILDRQLLEHAIQQGRVEINLDQ